MNSDFNKALMKLIIAQGIWDENTGIEYEDGMTDIMQSLAMAQASVIVSFLKTTGNCVPDEISAGCNAAYKTTIKTAMKMWNAIEGR